MNQKRPKRGAPHGGSPAARGGRPADFRPAIEAARRPDAEQAAATEGVDIDALRDTGDSGTGAGAAPAASPGDLDRQLREALSTLKDKQRIYDECAARARKREEQAADAERIAVAKAEELLQERADLEQERANVAQEHADVVAQAAVLREQGDVFAQRAAAITTRELEAEAGFPARRAALAEALEAELASQREQAAADLRNARKSHAATLAIQREALDAERQAFAAQALRQTADLDERRQSLAEEQTRLADELAGARRERAAIERRERHLDAEVQVQAAATIRQLDGELVIARAEAAAAAETVSRMAQELTDIRSRWEATGVEDPRLILTRLHKVQEEKRELQGKLDARLDDDSLDRLRWLEQQNRELNAERERLEYELQEERGRQLADRISNLQVQQLADAQQQFDVIRRGYEMRISELSGALGDLVDGRADPTDPLFPNCVALDDDPRLQEAGYLIDEVPDLHELARSLQGAMWTLSNRKYRLDDVCGVLGGMAMSHLHLLEGPSGIGKTSLPRALADAFATECAIIEVQAGWRDRYDLFGHYNTFERRFQEEPFLLALYKAQTPRYRHRPFFIVLDEMNLARPEQYFSVLLSRLESRDTEPIRLAPVPAGRRPQWMDDSGTGITIPDNVWFVGTANQDESTLEFADKTYNRSYVLELSAQRPYVPGGGRVQPFSAMALRKAFQQARQDHRPALKTVKELLTHLADDLYDVGRIQMDPRIEGQLDDYVPVVVAARGEDLISENGRGDKAGETFNPVALAADQFIASKLLHQLHSRFEVTPEGITRLEEVVDLYWPDTFPGTLPSRCRRVLADEQRRRKA